MNRIIQHTPAFVDRRDPPPRADFSTMDELCAIPFVKQWLDDKDYGTLAQDTGSLMAVSRGGSRWWVIGNFKEPVDFIPQWVEGEPGVEP